MKFLKTVHLFWWTLITSRIYGQQSSIAEDFEQLFPLISATCEPENSTTNASQTYAFPISITKSCCLPCVCEECAKGSCCPGVNNVSLTEQDIQKLNQRVVGCVYPQVRSMQLGKKNTRKYLMINKCPPGFNDTETKYRCERFYNNIDFSTMEPSDIQLVAPQSLRGSQKVFSNAFCAVCNGVGLGNDNLSPWAIALDCALTAKYTPQSVKTLADIPHVVDEYDQCNIVFKWDPKMGPMPFSCPEGIDRCNSTGNDVSYDAFTESACLSYTSIFAYRYKNVHCALCNGLTRENYELNCHIFDGEISYGSSYADLLDFNEGNHWIGHDRSDTKCTHVDTLLNKIEVIFCGGNGFCIPA